MLPSIFARQLEKGMKENQVRDINTAMYGCTKILECSSRKPPYISIIVDEGQNFSDNAYHLIRALAGEEHMSLK